MTGQDILLIIAMLFATGAVIVLFWKWNIKFTQRQNEWRTERVASILYGQSQPSWEQPWERAEGLVRSVYMDRAREVLEFTDRTVSRV